MISDNEEKHSATHIQRPIDLFLVIILSLIGVICTLMLQEGNPLRIIMAIPILIFFPGYALTSALWAKETENSIDYLSRITLSVGLSIAIVSAIGLLTATSVGLDLHHIIGGNMAIIMTFIVIAHYRRSRLLIQEQYNPFRHLLSPYSDRFEMMLTVLFISGIVVCSGFISYTFVNPAITEPYSEFYILDQNHTLESLPINLKTNETGTIIIGIQNRENKQTCYSIIAGIENDTSPIIFIEPLGQIDIGLSHYIESNVTLDDSQLFEQEYVFRFSIPGTYKLIWNLLIDGQETDYKLHLWVNVE